ASRGGHQRLGDAGADHIDARLVGGADLLERAQDAVDGAKEADERRRGADGGQKPQLTLEGEGDPLTLAVDRRLERARGGAPVTLEADQEELGGQGRAALAGGARLGDRAAVEAALDGLGQRARAIEEAPLRGETLDAHGQY